MIAKLAMYSPAWWLKALKLPWATFESQRPEETATKKPES
jgi:hypothetical protein